MNHHFPIGFMGGCGPHEIILRMSPEEIRTRLKKILRDESFVEEMFSTEQHYTGEIKDLSFTMRACKQPRGTQRPTLIGELEPTEGGTRIRFRIEPETWLLYIMFGFPILAMAAFMMIFGNLLPFYFIPIMGPVIFVVNSLFTRVWSGRVLRFFLESFGRERLA